MSKNLVAFAIIFVVSFLALSIFLLTRTNNDSSSMGEINTAQTNPPDRVNEGSSTQIQSEENKVNIEADSSEVRTEVRPGSYIEYTSQNLTGNTNVIFFAASWCPTCRSLDREINSDLGSIPSNLTILKADYDSETELKRRYGVTYQHTLVQVDKDGNLLKKWNGSQDIEAIVNQLI